MLFVQVDPAVETTVAPKDAKFYSSRNSVAANPDPKKEMPVPKLDGKQDKVIRTTSTPKPEALQPAPPKEQTPTQPAPGKEKAAESKPVDKTPGDDKPKPTDPSQSTDTTMGEDEIRPIRPRVRTLAEAKKQKGLLTGEKMKQDGGVRRRASMASVDAKATPFGAYDEQVIAAIQKRWFDILDERDYSREKTGYVVLEFYMHSDGRVTNVSVKENTVGEMLSIVCQKAVLDPAPVSSVAERYEENGGNKLSMG